MKWKECIFTFKDAFYRIEARLDGYYLISEFDEEIHIGESESDVDDLILVRECCKKLLFRLSEKMRKSAQAR